MKMIAFSASDPKQRDLMAWAARLRYRVYVEEMGREEPTADHTNRTLTDDLDAHPLSTVFCAIINASVVGTVRTTLDLTATYRDLYRLSAAPVEGVSLTTRMTIARSMRRSKVAYALSRACFELATRRKVLLNFIDANPPTDTMFRKLGFLPLGPATEHPQYGVVQPLVLSLGHTHLLRRQRSPFWEMSAQNYTIADAQRAEEMLSRLGHDLSEIVSSSVLPTEKSIRTPGRNRVSSSVTPVPRQPERHVSNE